MGYLLHKNLSFFTGASLVFFFVFFFVLFSVFMSVNPAHASQLLLSQSSSPLGIGQTVQVDINLKPEGEAFNAVGATLTWPAKLLEFKSIRDGGSIINFWVDAPYLSTDNSLTFSGITPGGFKAELGLVLSVIFKTKAIGSGNFKLDTIQLLRNDSAGSAIAAANRVLPITVSATASNTDSMIVSDSVEPEPFVINLARNQAVFDNQWFIVFSTQDKDSGVHHYEVAERYGALIHLGQNDTRLHWQEATSPYQLQDQSLKSGIYVRAVDRSGNERLATVAPAVPLIWYEHYQLYAILVLILILVIVAKRLWGVKTKTY